MCIKCMMKQFAVEQGSPAATKEQVIEGAVQYVARFMYQLTGQPLTDAELADVRAKASGYFDDAPDVPTQAVTAKDMLVNAAAHMADRAKTYDAPQGERSMGKTVKAFNVITGHNLSESDGWLFMVLLKAARANQGEFKADNFEDMTAYAALLGEAASAQAHQ